MGVLEKFLRAGEGKRVKQLAELVVPVNDLEPTMQALTDAELAALRARWDAAPRGEPARRAIARFF